MNRNSQRRRLPRSRVRFRDALSIGTRGLRARPGRTVLTATGIAIGIASMIAVLGISASSKAHLIAQIESLGTNMLEVAAGESIFGEESQLPPDAEVMVRRIGPVRNAATVTQIATTVRRNEYYDASNALGVFASDPKLLNTLEGEMRVGRFLDQNTATLPTVVLGSVAAQRLGIGDLQGAPAVVIASERFSVIGILESLPLNPDLDQSVFIGEQAAEDTLGAEPVPTRMYIRTTPESVDDVRGVLARTVNPTSPNEVTVALSSEALEARAAVDKNLQNLLLGLGGVALLVGGVGIANVMIISVLERRSEIGLRRSLGATRRHIATQFIIESASLALLGGIIGVLLGSAVTVAYASYRAWTVAVPASGLFLAIAATLALGCLAGLYPAVRAARLDPAEAVRPGG